MASECYNGVSCRTLLYKGTRTAMYTSAERKAAFDSAPPCMGVLSTPKELRTINGTLKMAYSPLIESARGELILNAATPALEIRMQYETPGKWISNGGYISGTVRTAWARYSFAATGRSFIYEAKVTINHGVGAWLAFKTSPDDYGGCVFMLDVQKGQAQLLRMPDMHILDRRKYVINNGTPYNLMVVSKDKFLELYIDGILIIQCVHYATREGHFALLVDRASAVFESPDA